MIGEIISAGANLLGGYLQGDRAEEAANTQYQHQKEFANNAIQWKVADASAAGINPYYALGASTTSYSPTSVGEGGIGKGLSDASQDIGRAASANQTAEEKTSDFQKKSQALALTKSGLENELLATQLAKQRAQIGPPAPSLSKTSTGQPAVDAATLSGFPIASDKLEQKAETHPKHGNITIGNQSYKTHPGWADAEDIETRYGDLVEKIYGVGAIGADAWHNARPYVDRAGGKFKNQARNFRNAVRGVGSWYGNNNIY